MTYEATITEIMFKRLAEPTPNEACPEGSRRIQEKSDRRSSGAEIFAIDKFDYPDHAHAYLKIGCFPLWSLGMPFEENDMQNHEPGR